MTIHDHPGKERIDAVRAFNRFYTRQIGVLDEGWLKSTFSLTEARVLYELAHRDGLVASDLVRDLGLDPGYVSRLLKKFEERGLVEREATEADARRASIALTPAGREAFAPLNQDSHDQVRALLDRLAPVDQDRLVKAMRIVQDLLGDRPEPKVPYILRPLEVGDIGWVTRRQGMLYAQDYGWDETYEALVAEILGEFVKKFDPKWERGWIAEREGEVVGSVFVVRKSDQVAKLRLLYVEPSARGLGIGKRLVEECIGFARARGYKTLTLWTNDILTAARHIYQAAGFKLTEEEPHHSFGKDLVGQNWDLEL
ncbi:MULTISPECIES: helix-turn-helix domain-containing GNAT family N-acetyltransferase [unclassified Mesorhizobium]|uniref:bifunctional helix-turn-helix transcriptional regulator/GNAT family N-acetyltransferase n=1 Tax=unclassified Mesorhizobium TaxID=325217 RepID=UPI000FD3BC40|nr:MULTISPECIES: helix-turn-helix domain-containing GNAT family N-acetyltransferase [unclassified Mesorhizobium]RVD50955.1 GNAT family N-acetyltransferase [Mesorhizobium sp. M8A.F.Ca.ET.023.02.2.1]TGR58584.1 GNAT family N-acetyltransferase [bacterium M00.F.Ca.ET.199.01.1.1]TGU41305.1 GNAT family N-acetyltransferase [bacterium M00.F.Ca.ET.156.01.1.1]TGV55370.1 GNAT family N-acetyltransferase [bacterium M00.F.Ca.ET.141.01.1.1]TGV90448.1 GNAT family N-acetyltransferase [Mesorhizobium sp. M00.F.Ca